MKKPTRVVGNDIGTQSMTQSSMQNSNQQTTSRFYLTPREKASCIQLLRTIWGWLHREGYFFRFFLHRQLILISSVTSRTPHRFCLTQLDWVQWKSQQESSGVIIGTQSTTQSSNRKMEANVCSDWRLLHVNAILIKINSSEINSNQLHTHDLS
jgi:hypothetical protein